MPPTKPARNLSTLQRQLMVIMRDNKNRWPWTGKEFLAYNERLAMERLVKRGFVDMGCTETSPGVGVWHYKLTEAGIERITDG